MDATSPHHWQVTGDTPVTAPGSTSLHGFPADRIFYPNFYPTRISGSTCQSYIPSWTTLPALRVGPGARDRACREASFAGGEVT
jgi:hypothetical protein